MAGIIRTRADPLLDYVKVAQLKVLRLMLLHGAQNTVETAEQTLHLASLELSETADRRKLLRDSIWRFKEGEPHLEFGLYSGLRTSSLREWRT